MKKFLIADLAAILLILGIVVVTAVYRAPWWCFIAEFFAYMMAFSHLMAVLLGQRNPYAARVLKKCTFVFGVLFILSLIALFILGQISF